MTLRTSSIVIDLQCGSFFLSLRKNPLDRISKSKERDVDRLSSMIACP